jgi:hypothetical protein
MNEHTAYRMIIEQDPLFDTRPRYLQELTIAAFIFGWESAKRDTIRLVSQAQEQLNNN